MEKSLKDFLSRSQVGEVTRNVNQATRDRRTTSLPVCDVLTYDYNILEDDEQYRFTIDREAREKLPDLIGNKVQRVVANDTADETFKAQYHRARNIGLVFSGGPAPGGHNVIAGLFDAAKKANPASRVYGFLMGPDGIIEDQAIEITQALVDRHRNLGGFGMIKTGRTKIDSKEKMALTRETCRRLNLDALVIVGGDDSNTNAAFLAQEMFDDGVQVIGVPKTIDGDVQVRDDQGKVLCAMSFGFHSAARGFAREVSNLCTDSSSDMKYWHICKVMGRSASHLALEVALQTHANMTLIGEDLADYVDRERLADAEDGDGIDFNAYGMTLRHLSRMICDAIVRRAAVGKNCGVLVIPEGVLEFINEIQALIIKLNTVIAEFNAVHDKSFHQRFVLLEDKLDYLRRLARSLHQEGKISVWNLRDDEVFNDIPDFFQEGLLTERDAHGNFQFSLVETDKVLMGLVTDYLDILKEKGEYKLGIDRQYFTRLLTRDGMDPERYGPVIFKNYPEGAFLLVKPEIISRKTLRQALSAAGLGDSAQALPKVVEKIWQKSIPSFKTQTHFYGYDGRGGNPTGFDCRYTYNLGLTVFCLIVNGATGQMAAIENLEKGFARWEPIGIPIAPLMHLEERKGKMALVLEKCLVDLKSPAFRIVRAFREKWLAAEPGGDPYRIPAPIHFSDGGEEDRPLTLLLNELGAGLEK